MQYAEEGKCIIIVLGSGSSTSQKLMEYRSFIMQLYLLHWTLPWDKFLFGIKCKEYYY